MDQETYRRMAVAEAAKWSDHLEVEASGRWAAWLDHPSIKQWYRQRSLVDGLSWPEWLIRDLGGPARRSLDLGCGAGERSFELFGSGATASIDGLDLSPGRVEEGERRRKAVGAPGSFRVEDVNSATLPAEQYDLVFSSHSFHHFLELERIMEQVSRALTPGGLFVLDEFVGPTRFQWTHAQIHLVNSLLTVVPEPLRKFPWPGTKYTEGRPTPEEVAAVSPFEAIRSGDIVPLFEQNFDLVVTRKLGGTLQHLFYNGIVHNFAPDDPAARTCLEMMFTLEATLIDAGFLPSDFMLLIGRKRR
jgi:SAM-dependent methyltransferase